MSVLTFTTFSLLFFFVLSRAVYTNVFSMTTHTLLDSSLAICDARQIVLLAFWVPREHNRVADFLSHLSSIHRSEVAGRFTPTQTHALAGAATGEIGPDALAALAATTLVPFCRAIQVFDPAVGDRFLQECTGQDSPRSSLCSFRGVSGPPSQPVQRPNNP